MNKPERVAYQTRLLDRLGRVMAEETDGSIFLPEEVWDELAIPEGMLFEACLAFVEGEIEKDELDHKATGFLRNWRETMESHTGKVAT